MRVRGRKRGPVKRESEQEQHKKYLQRYFKENHPECLEELPELFDNYRGREDVLFRDLAKRFGEVGLRFCPIPTVAPRKTDCTTFEHTMLSADLAVGKQPLRSQISAIASSYRFASVLNLRPQTDFSFCEEIQIVNNQLNSIDRAIDGKGNAGAVATSTSGYNRPESTASRILGSTVPPMPMPQKSEVSREEMESRSNLEEQLDLKCRARIRGEVQAFQDEGLKFAHVQWPHRAEVDADLMDKILERIASLPRPLFVYCGDGFRATFAVSMAIARRDGSSAAEVVRWGKELGHDFKQKAPQLNKFMLYYLYATTKRITFSR